LRQQLEVLDTGRFLWRGELWPGQHGALIIEEDRAGERRSGGSTTSPPRWRMRMTLSFPTLGPIDATVALSGESVDVSVRCAGPDTAARLRDAAPALRGAIAERALDVTAVTIADGRLA
jgi:hypothetical protein